MSPRCRILLVSNEVKRAGREGQASSWAMGANGGRHICTAELQGWAMGANGGRHRHRRAAGLGNAWKLTEAGTGTAELSLIITHKNG